MTSIQWWGIVLSVLWCSGVPTFGCPQRCSCHHDQDLFVANCSSLPYNGGKVEVLNLIRSPDDHPLELHDGQFNLAKHLKYLNLRNSSIYFIHKKAFYGAKSLIEIDLSFNQIQEIEPTVFQHLTSLTTLILRGNPIQFSMEIPFLISNTVQHLDIGQCNIRNVPRGIFYGLKRLKYLYMDGNLLKSLKYNSLPKGLKYLNLSQNLIEDVPTEVLSSLTSLRRIGLSGNPINCTCSLLNFQDYISGRGVVFEEEVKCAMPSEYRGVSLGKIDENKLCLAEARREDMSHPLFQNRFYTENYLDNDHGYMDENFQADEPGSLLGDSQSEVLFQNSETKAMGEMMRDEEQPTKLEEEKMETDKASDDEQLTENNEDSDTDIKTPVENEDTVNEDNHDNEENANEPVTQIKSPNPEENGEVVNENIHKVGENAEKHESEEESKGKNDENLMKSDHTSQDDHLDVSGVTESEVVSSNGSLNTNDENKDPDEKDIAEEDPKPNHEETVEIIAANNSTVKNLSLLAKEDLVQNNTLGNDSISNTDSSPSVILNETNPVEYKPLVPEDSKSDNVDELAEEGLLHANVDENKLSTNDSSEDSTIQPDIEETTEDDLLSTQNTFTGEDDHETKNSSAESILRSGAMNHSIIDDHSNSTAILTADDDSSKELAANVTVPGENIDLGKTDPNVSKSEVSITGEEDGSKATEDKKEEEHEVIEPAVTESTILQHEAIPPLLKREPAETSGENAALREKDGESKPEDGEKIKQVAGADIVMFCIAILVICLVLFSVYKCRNSKVRQTTRVPKDVEANRGTEMQDMASLLPKPEDDDKKNHKYPDKEPSSETMKLIPEVNEKESPNFAAAANQNNVEDKNLINNNAPGSPTSKTPLIKPSNPIVINPAAPIQRTKAKVGIIPDSIPRTPIFLQKTYTNGTKQV